MAQKPKILGFIDLKTYEAEMYDGLEDLTLADVYETEENIRREV